MFNLMPMQKTPDPFAQRNWFENPQIMGLLQAGLGILGAKGTYGALGPALSQGGLLGLQGVVQAKQMQDQRNDRAFERYVGGKKLDLLDRQIGEYDRKHKEAGMISQGIQGAMNPPDQKKGEVPDPANVAYRDMADRLETWAAEHGLSGNEDIQKQVKSWRDHSQNLFNVEKDNREQPIPGMPWVFRDPRTGQTRVDESLRQQYLEKQEAGASNLNLFAPQPGVDAEGNSVFFQPNKRGGPPTIVPGVTPKPPEGYSKQSAGIKTVTGAMSEYKDMLTKSGGYIARLTPSERLKLGTAYNNMMLQAKEAYNLGVLNGPDYMILQQVVKNPLDMKNMIYTAEDLKAQVDVFDKIMANVKENLDSAYGKRIAPQGKVVDDPAGLR